MPVCRAGLVLMIAVLPLAAQEPLPVPAPRRDKWLFTAAVSAGWGGPARDMEAHLLAVGGFESEACGTVGCEAYPTVHNVDPQLSIGLGRRLTERISVQAVVGAGALGWTAGLGSSGSVSRHWSNTSLAGLVTLELAPVVWLGAGPVVAWLRSGPGAPGSYPADSIMHMSSFGLQVEAGVRTSARKRVFGRLFVSYRYLPLRTEGPYPLEIGTGELPAYEANYSLLTIGVGVGARFGS